MRFSCRWRFTGVAAYFGLIHVCQSGALLDRHRESKIKYRVGLLEALHNAPVAVNSLFDGAHGDRLAAALP